jgi:hypothetical protein
MRSFAIKEFGISIFYLFLILFWWWLLFFSFLFFFFSFFFKRLDFLFFFSNFIKPVFFFYLNFLYNNKMSPVHLGFFFFFFFPFSSQFPDIKKLLKISKNLVEFSIYTGKKKKKNPAFS